jgi:uncharacterized damage-inducible protein DinB
MTPTATSTPGPDVSSPPRADASGAVSLAAHATLEQCAAFIASLSGDVYGRPSATIKGSTIGQHVRHALDHFAAAVGAMDGAVIDYDHRERDTPLERDGALALGAIRALQSAIGRIGAGATGAPVRVRVMISGAGDEAVLTSTLGRELAFATHHAIHHHAMIASIAREHGVEPPAGFGRAPSTLHHEGAPIASR